MDMIRIESAQTLTEQTFKTKKEVEVHFLVNCFCLLNCRMSMSGFGLLEAIELTVTAPEKCLVSVLSSDCGEGIILSG